MGHSNRQREALEAQRSAVLTALGSVLANTLDGGPYLIVSLPIKGGPFGFTTNVASTDVPTLLEDIAKTFREAEKRKGGALWTPGKAEA